MTRNELMAEHLPSSRVYKKTGTVKKSLRFGFHWGSVSYFKALGNAYSVAHVKWANDTTGVSVCIVLYATFNGSLCAHKSLHIVFIFAKVFEVM